MSKSTVNIQAAVRTLNRLSPLRPTLAIVFGSGFDTALRSMQQAAELPYQSVPGFPVTGVRGHEGTVAVGCIGGVPLMVLRGRAHYYEGHPMEHVTFPVRVLAALGIRDLLLTNAAGGIKPTLRPGDFMLLTDHINLMGVNPLRGPRIQGLPQFVDLTRVYDSDLAKLVSHAARLVHVRLQKGVYIAVAGPSYETPAEIRAFKRLGADAVGMSVVPEALVARQCGIRVTALSCITNLAAGKSPQPLSHTEVLATAARVAFVANELLTRFVKLYGQRSIAKNQPLGAN